jgi:ABC-type transporter Mla subunit MlaD
VALRQSVPYEIGWIDRLVGLVIVMALVLLAVAIVRHFRGSGPEPQALDYHTLLQRAHGITQGADIRLAGIAIGKVGKLSLQRDGHVRLDLHFEPEYGAFITHGSYLEIASTMGLAAVVDLTRLKFITNLENDEPLPQGSLLKTVEPTDLAETFSTSELEKMTTNVKAILENLARLSETAAENRTRMAASLENIEGVSREVRYAITPLPDIVDSAKRGFGAWEKAGVDLHRVIGDAGQDVRQIGSSTVAASARLNEALGELRQLVAGLNQVAQRVQQSADQMPQILSDAHALIAGANRLIDQINRHWLLGSGGQETRPIYSPSIHPPAGPGGSPGPQVPISGDR